MKSIKILPIIGSIFLGVALSDMPYGYYKLLRIFIFVITGCLLFYSYHAKKTAWSWLFGIIAYIFNPIIPMHMDRATWQLVDVSVIVLFVVWLLSFWNEFKKTTQWVILVCSSIFLGLIIAAIVSAFISYSR